MWPRSRGFWGRRNVHRCNGIDRCNGICPLSHDVILNLELLRTVGKVASTFECELGCQCLYENGVNLQVSEVCVYATYLVVLVAQLRHRQGAPNWVASAWDPFATFSGAYDHVIETNLEGSKG